MRSVTDIRTAPLQPIARSLGRSIPARSAAVAIAGLLLYLAAGPVPESLVLARATALSSQPWGLVTGHLTHGDPGHLLWDSLGLLLVGLVYEPLLGRRFWLVLGAGLIAINGAFLWLFTGFDAYCGLSGLINALVGGGLIAALRTRDRWAIGFGLLVMAKVLTETLTGSALLTDTAWPALHGAHAAGLLGGLVGGLLGGRAASMLSAQRIGIERRRKPHARRATSPESRCHDSRSTETTTLSCADAATGFIGALSKPSTVPQASGAL